VKKYIRKDKSWLTLPIVRVSDILAPVRLARAQMSARDKPVVGVAHCVTIGLNASMGISNPALSGLDMSTQPLLFETNH